MSEPTGWPKPGRLTKIIGVLFTALHLLSLCFWILFWARRQPGLVDLRTVVIGLAVGITYLAGELHPMIRIVPSVLWVVLAGIPSIVSRLMEGPWTGGDARGSIMAVLCATLLVCALAYHVYLDARLLLARSRAEARDATE